MSDWIGVHASDGTAQNDRFPQPLRDDHFHLDEMSFEDLLAITAEFASKLHFYNAAKARGLASVHELASAIDGTWSDLFTADEVVIMAQICSTDLKRLRSAFLQKLHSGPQKAAEFIYELAHMLDTWFKGLAAVDHPSAVGLGAKIAEVIKSLPPFDKMPEDRASKSTFLQSAGDSFLHAIAYLQSVTPQYLQDSLVSGKHNPAIGLFIAFLRLFATAQESMNTLTRRHLEFYYREFLKAVPQGSVPDSAWLVLQADPSARSVRVEKGTAFAAGKDSRDNEVVYVAANDVVINDARVRALSTLCLERNTLISPEKELGYITRSRIHRFATIGGREGVWPVFGAEMKETCQGTAEDAEIGFAFASPVLFLREGLRTITMDLDFSDSTSVDGTVSILLTELLARPRKPLDQELTDALTSIFARYLLTQPELWTDHYETTVAGMAGKMAAGVALETVRALLQQGAQDRLYDLFLMELLDHARSPEVFFQIFGMIFRRNLLSQNSENQERMTAADKNRISAKADALLIGSTDEISIGQVRELLKQTRRVLFSRLLRHAFTITLTTSAGWYEARAYAITSCAGSEHAGELGLRCTLHLDAEVDPIVACVPAIHGGQWNTLLPILRCQLNPLSYFYHYSLFEGLRLRAVTLETRVEGIKTFLAYNNEGQLDPSKPFLPFGALPARNAYLRVGNLEVARKNISHLNVNIEWGGLPTQYGGFRTYYQSYDTPFQNDVFQIDVSALRDGEWQPLDRTKRQRCALFETAEGDIVGENRVIEVDAVRYLKPMAISLPDEEFKYDLRTRSGFINFTLVSPEGAFGHKDYSILLTRSLSENAKVKKPMPLPNPPYTPLINRITIDYVARDVIHVSTDTKADAGADQQVFQLHPFGIRSVYPKGADSVPTLLPTFHYDGNLFVGLEGTQIKGALTLFFHMAQDSTRELSGEDTRQDSLHPTITWFYLASNHWSVLERPRVLSDTTQGFLRSGIVTLDIPEELTSDNTVMPSGLFWLRAAASGDLESFPSLYTVYTHGLTVTRRVEDSDYPGVSLPEGTIRQSVLSIPGMTQIRQISPSFGGRMSENSVQFKIRLSERLHHKNRATMPWDYEHLVLERFPDVFKVKCFPNLVTSSRTPQPGHVLVVVVPMAEGDSLNPRLDAVELGSIRTFLQNLASPCAKINVRNPHYERIQIRCGVKFKNAESSGLQINRLNDAIVDFISPWRPGGYEARFGWCIRTEDIQSFILGLDFVDFVTDFSILHITDDRGDFILADTARFWPITSGSFRDFRRFVLALRDARDPVSQYLREQLQPETRQTLDGYAESEGMPSEVLEAIITDLNGLLLSGPLYDEPRFDNVALSEETQKRLDANPKDTELVALNRLLLEDSYPNVFEVSPARAEEIRPRYPWSIAIPMKRHSIESLDAKNPITAEATGIADLEVVSNFIIS